MCLVCVGTAEVCTAAAAHATWEVRSATQPTSGLNRRGGGFTATLPNTLGAKRALRLGLPLRKHLIIATLVLGTAAHAVAPASPQPAPSRSELMSVQFEYIDSVLKVRDGVKLDGFILELRNRVQATTGKPRAEWDLVLARALIGKYTQRLGSLSDAKESFHAVKAAFALAPAELAVALSYGRSIRGLTKLSDFKRPWATGRMFGVDIDLENEVRSVVDTLERHHVNNASAQIIQAELGAFLKDAIVVSRAEANIAALPAKDLAIARAALANDDTEALKSPDAQ